VHLAVALPDRSSGLTQHIPRIDVPFDVEPMFLPDFELELLTVEISDQIPSSTRFDRVGFFSFT